MLLKAGYELRECINETNNIYAGNNHETKLISVQQTTVPTKGR
jgi:hypothetical protein